MSVVVPDRLAIDPQINIKKDVFAVINKGPQASTRNAQIATDVSPNTIQYTIQLNNQQNLISRYMKTKTPLTVTLNATDGGYPLSNLLNNGLFAPRQFPLSSVTNSLAVTINNQSSSVEPYKWIHQLSLFPGNDQAPDVVAKNLSLSPWLADQSQNYSDLATSSKNPLASYENSQFYSEGRGSFNGQFQIVSSSNTQLVFTWDLIEPVMHPLFTYDPSKKSEAFMGLNQLVINYTLLDAARMFSLDTVSAPNVTSINVSIGRACELQMIWFTTYPEVPYPDHQIIPFNKIMTNTSQLQVPISPGASTQLQSQTFAMSACPKKIWISAQNNTNAAGLTGASYTDSYLQIQNVNIIFNNVSSLLSNYSIYDLYDECVASEGSVQTFEQFAYHQGGVICIDTVKLLQLPQSMCPGVLAQGGSINFSVQLTVKNISSNTITPLLTVFWAIPSVYTSTINSTANINEGYFSQEEVLTAYNLEQVDQGNVHDNIYGGRVADKLKSLLQKGLDFAKQNKLVSKGLAMVPHPYGQFASQIASNLGFGGCKRCGGPMSYGGCRQCGSGKVNRRFLASSLKN